MSRQQLTVRDQRGESVLDYDELIVERQIIHQSVVGREQRSIGVHPA